MNKTKVLVIDDDPMMLDLADYQLRTHGYEVTTAETGEEGLKLFAEYRHEITLTDLRLPDLDGIELIRKLKEIWSGTEIIMVTGYGSMASTVEAIKAGAFFFIRKPVEFEELFVLIEKAIEHRRKAGKIRRLHGRLRDRACYYNLIGGSPAMQSIYEIIDSVAESDANIMIVGESGTGKELVANAIHDQSARAGKPFVKINCSALPKELIESELFGHAKGAFTGAMTDRVGLIGQAMGGSLLLDEVGAMPIELQPKLLRVLQERVYCRLGSEKALKADFRLISATNHNAAEAIRDGQLREDLYYRINTIEVQMPPLRERAEDVRPLAEHFLRMYAEKYHRPVHSISRPAYEKMFAYRWPGNVRELQNVMERAVLFCKGGVIEEHAVPDPQSTVKGAVEAIISLPTFERTAAPLKAETTANPSPPLQDLNLDQLARLIVTKISNPKTRREWLDVSTQLEGSVVRMALERTRGNKMAAANLLGLYRPRFYTMLRKHNLHHTIRGVTPTS